ncbi:unnamed protein product [Urochloa humidicola]
MALCEGDLSTGDCGQCVTHAVQHDKVECGVVPSGQVYLHRCYISYSYYPHGVPNDGGMGVYCACKFQHFGYADRLVKLEREKGSSSYADSCRWVARERKFVNSDYRREGELPV